MRRTAYMKAIQEAKKLPTEIPELRRYFKDCYNPQQAALAHIMKTAREDTDALFDHEFVEVYQEMRKG